MSVQTQRPSVEQFSDKLSDIDIADETRARAQEAMSHALAGNHEKAVSKVRENIEETARGQVGGNQDGLLDLVVAVGVGLLVFAILGSIALDQFSGVDTTNWSPEVVDMWEVVPVLMLVAVILGAIAAAIKQL